MKAGNSQTSKMESSVCITKTNLRGKTQLLTQEKKKKHSKRKVLIA